MKLTMHGQETTLQLAPSFPGEWRFEYHGYVVFGHLSAGQFRVSAIKGGGLMPDSLYNGISDYFFSNVYRRDPS